MHPIPKPELLDPGRVSRDDREAMSVEDHRSQARLLDKALHESCAYGDQLWDQLDNVRHYLLDSLPPRRRAPGAHVSSAAPTGRHDERGWQNWMKAFADTTSVLCGAHGDSGFGESRAREEAQLRRTVPDTVVDAPARPAEAAPSAPEPEDAATTPPVDPQAPHTTGLWVAKAIGGAVVAVLAIRGLRPRRAARSTAA